MEEQYIQILEKTNQQLGLWTNPYGLIVGVLAILFTVLTIVAVFIVYRQGKEYKEKLESDREQYRKNIEEFLSNQKNIIEKREKQAEEVEKKIDNLIEEYKKDLDKSSSQQKDEIKKAIKRLEEEKVSLNNTIGPLTVSPNTIEFENLGAFSVASMYNNYHKCTSCGFGFFIKNDDYRSITLTILGNKTVTCPKCGNVDRI